MNTIDVITIFVTVICLVSFCVIFTLLFGHYNKSNIESVSSGKEDIDLIDDHIMQTKQNKKVRRLVTKIISYFITAVVLVFFSFSLVSRIKGNTMFFGSKAVIVIASGSMSQTNSDYIKEHPQFKDQFDTYDMITIEKYKSQSDVKEGDVVAYKNQNKITIVHRIIEVRSDGTYLTQGDSNTAADNYSSSQYSGYLNYSDIIGRYTGKRVKGLGAIIIFLQSPSGIITIVALIYLLLMIDYYNNRLNKKTNERTSMLLELLDLKMDEDETKEMETTYKEQLRYKDVLYTFEDGKFLSKENIDSDKEYRDDVMLKMIDDGKEKKIEVIDTKKEEKSSVKLDEDAIKLLTKDSKEKESQ